MKKAILSSLGSALVIPGLGQILNQEFRKGLLLLLAVFLIFVGGCVKLALIINVLMKSTSTTGGDPQRLLLAIKAEKLGWLWVLVALFAVIWVYSVIDAFRSGRKLEAKKRHEIVSD